MNEQTDKMPEGAARGLTMILDGFATAERKYKDLEELVLSQQRLITKLEARMETIEDCYQRLLTVVQKSIIKIDEQKLGMN